MATIKKYTPNQPLKDAKWLNINHVKDYFDCFTDESSKLEENTLQAYKTLKKYYEDLANNKYKNISNELLDEQNIKSINRLFNNIDKIIDTIANSKLEDYDKSNASSTLNITLSQAQDLVTKWNDLQRLAYQQKWKNLDKELKTIQIYCDELNDQLKSNDSTCDLSFIIDLSNEKKSVDKAAASTKTLKSAMSIVTGTLNRIQGEVLEQRVVQLLKKKMPTDCKIYQTGSVTVNGKKIKPDLVAIFNDLRLVNAQGEDTYIFQNGKILDATNNKPTDNVTLTEYELNQLLKNSMGFSAKTSSGNIKFQSGANINFLLNQSLTKHSNKAAIYQLIHFYQLGLQDVSNATLYQKYVVAKMAKELIGSNNAFLVTKEGIYPTYQYLANAIISSGGRLSFSETKLPKRVGGFIVEYGKTDIIGPHG